MSSMQRYRGAWLSKCECCKADADSVGGVADVGGVCGLEETEAI